MMRQMVKKLAIILFVVPILPLSGCGDFSCKDLFTPKSVRVVRGDDIERLKKKAEEYDKRVDDRIESAEKAGTIYQKLGEKYLERQLWDLSIESLEKAIGYGRNTPVVHYSIGVAYANKAQELNSSSFASKAEFHYKRALEIQPDYQQASYGLGILYFYIIKDRKRGLEEMETVVRKDRNYYLARFALARFHYELNNPAKSLSLYEDLYADLQGLPDSSEIKAYRESCKQNIERLMSELSREK